MNIKSVTFFSIILIVSQSSFSQTLNTAKLDSFFDVLSRKNEVMGSFAISRYGKVVYTRAIGFVYDEGKSARPVNESTLYYIGSITKLFTATVIYQLIDEGKLSLVTTLDKYYPQIPNSASISIEDLLSHRAGLYDFLNDNEDKSWAKNPQTADTILRKISNGKTHFLPGTDFSYSNSGYWLLANIIQKVTGQSYKENLQKRICERVGLKHTRAAFDSSHYDNEAGSYTFIGNWIKMRDLYLPNDLGAGNILSTPTDLILFDEALLGGKLISAQSLKTMKINSENLGTGITQSPFYTRAGFGHSGDTYGTHSSVANYADDQLTIAYCINGEVYPHNDIAIGVLKICFNSKYEIPTFEWVQIPDSLLYKYAGSYTCPKIPIKIFIIKSGVNLLVQPEGEDVFMLYATDHNQFKHESDGIVVEFNVKKNEMTFKQDGESYIFNKIFQ